jgi:hypothetical protein
MALGLFDPVCGTLKFECRENAIPIEAYNILLELRVISTILLAENQGQVLVESIEQLRIDQITAYSTGIV